MLANNLKAKMKRQELTVGTWMTFSFWPGYLEIYKAAGLDFVVLDLEHGSASLTEAENLCLVARLLDLPLIIRAEASRYERLRKYADLGPAGFMLPWVEREEQIITLREAIFCHPAGRRGPGGPSIFGAPNLNRDGWDAVEGNFCVMVQVETPTGIQAMTRILDHEWIDGVVVGPYDLCLNMKHCYEPAHPEMVEAFDRIIAGCRQLGKPCGMPVGSVEEARHWRDRGCSLFVYGEPATYAIEKTRDFLAGISPI